MVCGKGAIVFFSANFANADRFSKFFLGLSSKFAVKLKKRYTAREMRHYTLPCEMFVLKDGYLC